MSKAEGYTVHVYCDVHEHVMPKLNIGCDEFTGRTKADAYKIMRQAGWVLSRKDDIAVCPDCAAEGLSPKDCVQKFM